MKENIPYSAPEQEKRESLQKATFFINAGGRGTRLETILPANEKTGITKALIRMGEQSLLDYHIQHALKMGFGNIVVSAGDHDSIAEHLQKQNYGDEVSVFSVAEQQGTGGDLLAAVEASPNLKEEIIIQNVDTFVLYDEAKLLEAHLKREPHLPATILLTGRAKVPNENAWTVGKDGLVLATREAGQEDNIEGGILQASSTGVVVFDTEWLKNFSKEATKPLSIYADILPQLIKEGQLNSYYNDEFLFYDVGTPESYNKTVANPAFIKAIEKYY